MTTTNRSRRMSGQHLSGPGREAAQEETLFGPPAAVPTQRQTGPGRPQTQDMDLVEAVIATAREPGYVLIGTAERVYRRCPDRAGEVERVPEYEDAAVHQLITRKLLTVGGAHPVRCGQHQGRANSVLVPRDTVAQADRWRRYQRPASWGTRRHNR